MPAAQETQPQAAEEKAYLPTPQKTQAVAPVAGWYWPAGQVEQLQETLAPNAREKRPAGQLSQEVDPVVVCLALFQ